MLFVIALIALLGWSIAVLSITALVLGVLPLLSTDSSRAPKTGEKPVDKRRVACTVCGAHTFLPVPQNHPSEHGKEPPQVDLRGL